MQWDAARRGDERKLLALLVNGEEWDASVSVCLMKPWIAFCRPQLTYQVVLTQYIVSHCIGSSQWRTCCETNQPHFHSVLDDSFTQSPFFSVSLFPSFSTKTQFSERRRSKWSTKVNSPSNCSCSTERASPLPNEVAYEGNTKHIPVSIFTGDHKSDTQRARSFNCCCATTFLPTKVEDKLGMKKWTLET